jgi:hypothetical protein
MSKNLIVRLTAVALMLTLPVAAFAQTSRVEGLALQGDYIKDYTGIYTYLSSIPTVGNLVYGELGTFAGGPTPADRSMGAVLGNLWDGRFGTWGIHLRQQTSQLGQGDQASGTGAGIGRDPNSNFNESFDLMWGKKLNNTNLGLRLNRSFRKDKLVTGGITTNLEFDNAVGNNNLGRNIMGYGAGLGFEMNQNTSVELSALMETRTFENTVTPPGTSNKDDGGSTYQIAGRMMWQWTPSVMVTPVIKLYNFDLSRKTVPAANFSNKLSGWQAGLAGNWTVGTSDLFVLGATFAQNTLEEDEDLFGYAGLYGAAPTMKLTETMSPQVFTALETHINRWLTLRFGATKGSFQKTKVENTGAAPAFTREVSISSFRMNLGAGVKLGTLQLDAILANTFPHTLGWVGSGIANVYFPKVTATYAF